MAVTKEIVSDEKHKPVLNEEILAKLLEAAWVLQEHNRAQQKVDLSLELHSEQLREQEQTTRTSASTTLSASAAPSSAAGPGDYTSTLAKIVETQHQIQLRQLDFESSMAMVLERLHRYHPRERRGRWSDRRKKSEVFRRNRIWLSATGHRSRKRAGTLFRLPAHGAGNALLRCHLRVPA